jgi:hypothetical protein
MPGGLGCSKVSEETSNAGWADSGDEIEAKPEARVDHQNGQYTS